jgi:drug/metabolite transporter (DMT)-like permease
MLFTGTIPALISTVGTGIYSYFDAISSRLSGWYYTSLGIRIVIPCVILIYFSLKKERISGLFKSVPWKWVVPAALCDVIAFTSQNYAVIKYDISYVTIMSKAAPIISALLAVIFLKEKLRPYQVVGLLIVVFGIISLNI